MRHHTCPSVTPGCLALRSQRDRGAASCRSQVDRAPLVGGGGPAQTLMTLRRLRRQGVRLAVPGPWRSVRQRTDRRCFRN